MQIDVEDYYRRFGPMVLRRCRGLLGNEADALDAMQQTFVQVLEHAGRLTDDAPSSLLYRMATHVCLNRIRQGVRQQVAGEDLLVFEIAQLPDTSQQVEARNLLQQLFGRQQASTRQIAAMFWLEGYTYAEIAAVVGMSVSGVRRRLRALQRGFEQRGVLPRGVVHEDEREP